MKSLIASLLAVSALATTSYAADVTAKISDTHVCCHSCVKVAADTVTNIPGVTAVASQEDETITITGPDTASVQKATDELVAGGFYGTMDNPDIKINANTGATGAKLTTMDVSNLHLCCGKCVKAVDKILSTVPGVTTNTAAVHAKTFTITGNFTDTDVFAAFQKAGLTGKEGAP